MAAVKGAKMGVGREVLACIQAAERPLTGAEAVSRTGRSRTAVEYWLAALRREGKIARTGDGRAHDPYRYAAPTKEG